MTDPSRRPNVLVILTDQQRFPTPYEPEELHRWRHDEFAAERRLHETGVSFAKHYAMAAACAPSRDIARRAHRSQPGLVGGSCGEQDLSRCVAPGLSAHELGRPGLISRRS
jgi:hypothetical protein